MQIQNYMAVILGSVLMFLSVTSNAFLTEENFDGQTNGQRCSPPFWPDSKDSTIDTDPIRLNSKSCKFAVTDGGLDWGGGFVFGAPDSQVVLIDGDQAWIRFRLFIPQGFDYNSYDAGNRLKFIRIALKSAGGVVNYLNWYWLQEGQTEFPPYGIYMSGDACTTDCWQYFGDNNAKPVRGAWETYEMYVKFGHTATIDGGQAMTRIWKNGKLIGELIDRPTMWPDSVEAVSFKIFSYWNGGAPATQHLYFDDLVATSVVPGTKDVAGNPYIGVGDFVYVAPPDPPTPPR